MGELQVVCGPMFSGKSEELMRRLRRSQIAGKNTILISPQIDSRNKDRVVSHNGTIMLCVKAANSRQVLHWSDDYDVVGIDEVQFFGPSIITVVLYIARDRTVIVSGLDTNYRFEPFGVVPDLMAYAEKVDKLSAICNKCGLEATKTQRLIDGEPAPMSGPEILIGGLETYEARCRDCFEIK